MTTSNTVETRLHTMLAPPRRDLRMVTAGIGPDGELTSLWSDPSGLDASTGMLETPNGVRFPRSVAERPTSCTVLSSAAPGDLTTVSVEVANPLVQPLPEGRLLLTAVRCRYAPDGPAHNAAVYDAAGDLAQTGVLGDGIAHLATTRAGGIWTAYFDEGVYGNFGWGGQRGPAPLGSYGIVEFDGNSLDPRWRFPSGTGAPAIDDCYALNVTDDAVMACYYADFPLVRIAGGNVEACPTDLSGVSNVLFDGATVALIGGYGEDRGRVVIGTVEDGRFRPRGLTRMARPSSGQRFRSFARGDELHLVSETEWRKISLDDLTAAAS